MKIKYFTDTDTALLEFTQNPIAETRGISETISIDLDAKGNVVSMTIEHAKQGANLSEVAFQEMQSA